MLFVVGSTILSVHSHSFFNDYGSHDLYKWYITHIYPVYFITNNKICLNINPIKIIF